MLQQFPSETLTSHLAILGKTGSGKTYAAKGLAEELLSAGARVCIVDPTGAWHGLRSSADGKRPGFPVTIFGGSHGDLPLAASHGEAIAEILGTSNTPAILDTSQLRVSERTRLFADFADALMRKNKGPLHLFLDEAHVFAPQGKVPDPQSGIMLAAANNLVSGGRSRGLRIVLITQRPAKLHKDALTQVETLVAMRLVAPQDRRAVEEWIRDNADQAKGREIIESLAALKTGQGWIWAPELAVLDRFTFPRIRTFDSSRAPEHGESGAGPVVAAVDRGAIAERLKAAGADALANDPAALRRRIADLERTQAAKPKAAPAPAAPAGPSPEDLAELWGGAHQLGFDEGQAFCHEALQQLLAGWLKWSRPNPDDLKGHLALARRLGLKVLMERGKGPGGATRISMDSPDDPPPRDAGHRAAPAAPAPRAERRPPAQLAPRAETSNGATLPKGEAAILRACIQYPDGLRREQLTVLTGYKRSSRDDYTARAKAKGLLETQGDLVRATEAGIAALPDAEPLPRGEALQDFWRERLPLGERKILEELLRNYPAPVTREHLSQVTGYKRSSRDDYLSRLRAKELVQSVEGAAVRAVDQLF